ncbi:MAG: hypothetical protein C0622_09800 [Desulfuromonas sp.]|nr:MAG: hypothetical protein C0622_09800 [Desulfuromonas sp.]
MKIVISLFMLLFACQAAFAAAPAQLTTTKIQAVQPQAAAPATTPATKEYPGVGWKEPVAKPAAGATAYPGVGWQTGTAAQGMTVVEKPLAGNIVIKPQMRTMQIATADAAALRASFARFSEYYDKAQQALVFPEENASSGTYIPAPPNPAAGIASAFENMNGTAQPKNLFELIEWVQRDSATCADRAYTIADQHAAGCVATETLENCQAKLLRYCANEVEKKYNAKAKVNEAVQALADVGDMANRLRNDLRRPLN